MTTKPLTDNQLVTECVALINKAKKTDVFLYNTLNTLFLTGCRYSELVDGRFELLNSTTVVLNSTKGSNLRYFSLDTLPSELVQSLINSDAKYFTSPYTTAQYHFRKLLARSQYHNGLKRIDFHLFRHAFVKSLKLQGLNTLQIQTILGDRVLKNVMYYIDSKIIKTYK